MSNAKAGYPEMDYGIQSLINALPRNQLLTRVRDLNIQRGTLMSDIKKFESILLAKKQELDTVEEELKQANASLDSLAVNRTAPLTISEMRVYAVPSVQGYSYAYNIVAYTPRDKQIVDFKLLKHSKVLSSTALLTHILSDLRTFCVYRLIVSTPVNSEADTVLTQLKLSLTKKAERTQLQLLKGSRDYSEEYSLEITEPLFLENLRQNFYEPYRL